MGTKLQASFKALYAALEIPRVARWTVANLLLIHTGLLAYSAYVHSPTLNEPAHLVAGLSYWKFGRFDVYNVNPPLVKMVAALPVMAAGCDEDWSGFYEGPGARPEMPMGENFVAANGERSFFLFMIARWACIPFSWIGAVVCYLWARDLYGRPSGVMAAAIWCFEPNILAHAALITSDAAGTALGLAACYTFWRWLKQPTWSQAALTGVVLGLAELTKTTLILFYPLWPFMWLVYRWPDHTRMVARDWLREVTMLALRMLIGLYVLNLGYGFEGSFQQLKEYHFVSDLFTGKEQGVGSQASANPRSEIRNSKSPSNRFADSLLGNLPVPFPKNYLLGIDIQQKDFEHYGRPSYLRGVWQDHGWWYYYLYAAVIKVPLGFWALGLMTLVARLLGTLKPYGSARSTAKLTTNSQRLTASPREEFILLFPAIVIFTVVSSKTGFSEHFRYVLPALAPLFVATSQITQLLRTPASFRRLPEKRSRLLQNWISRGVLTTTIWWSGQKLRSTDKENRVLVSSGTLVALLGLWFVASSLWIYPHSLSYFNESIGGPLNGPRHLLGSNVDWGQDLLYASTRANRTTSDEYYQIVYTCMFDPADVGISVLGDLDGSVFADDPHGGNTKEPRTNKCLLIISLNVLHAVCYARAGTSELESFVQQWRVADPVSYSMSCFVRR